MKREEIEKAIENGESVWCVYKDTSSIYEIKAVEIEKVLNDTFLWGKKYYSNIKDVFKTKAEVEHYLHHANVTRTEKLPFLTWEEFKEEWKIKFTGDDGKDYVLQLDYDNEIIALYGTSWDTGVDEEWEATEANFYKAYDECVELFRGKAND